MAVLSGCGGSAPLRTPETGTVSQNDGLNSTLWATKSAEYDATTMTIYAAAQQALTSALNDREWTALPDQRMETGYSDLPPAVVLDVDETVLDNGEYQAGLVLNNETFTPDSWLKWVLQGRAVAIPGALEFTQQAAADGVTVIYLTNRTGEMEAATRRNLLDLGFPIDTTFDVVLTRGERPEWRGSDKTARRRYAEQHFRILALVGDNLGDFVNIRGLNVDHRDSVITATVSFWGKDWFMVPNPQYGSWESAAFNGRYDLSLDERRELKLRLLQSLLSH